MSGEVAGVLGGDCEIITIVVAREQEFQAHAVLDEQYLLDMRCSTEEP